MIFMAKRPVWKHLLPMMLLAAVSVAVGGTGAVILHTLRLENPIRTPTVSGEIEETIEGNHKNARFINTGEADVFLRVAYSETWIDGDGNILPNMADGEPVAVPDWDKNSGDWDWSEADTKGWVYYNHVLPGRNSGLDTRETGYLVTDVDFGRAATLKDTRYKNAKYRLHFTMEIVQASDDVEVSKRAVAKMFGKGIGNGWSTAEEKYRYIISWTNDPVDPDGR